MTVESAQGCSVPLWMWPWGRRGTSVRRKAAELLSQGLPVKAEVHLLPHSPMHDSEVANMCVQKTNLFCKVYSKNLASKKMEFGWTSRNQVRSGRTSNGKPYNLPRVRRNLGLSDLSPAEKNPYTSQNLKTDIHGELTERSLCGFLTQGLETLR